MTQGTAVAVPKWTLGDRLRKAREHAGLEQGELAAEIGISRGTISNYETGRGVRPPKPIVLRAWAVRCDVPIEWLLTGESPRPDGPDGGSAECAIRDSNPEPAGSVDGARIYEFGDNRAGDPLAARRLAVAA